MNQRITIGTYSIAWNDTWHYIEVSGYILNLTPTQYRICRAFLAASDTKPSLVVRKFAILSYQSCDELLDGTNLPRSVLIKHISDLNARITTSGLELCSFKNGYILTFSSNREQIV
jgi:hypothetical protein